MGNNHTMIQSATSCPCQVGTRSLIDQQTFGGCRRGEKPPAAGKRSAEIPLVGPPDLRERTTFRVVVGVLFLFADFFFYLI
jgi:hypothetical protein